jgi:transmembrane sensor
MKTPEKIQAEQLLKKYAEGNCSQEELSILESWYLSFDAEGAGQLTAEQFEQIQATTPPLVETPGYSLWLKLCTAAAATVITVFGIYFFNVRNKVSPQLTVTSPSTPDTFSGSKSATLVLSGGRKIKLTDRLNGEIVNEAGVVVSKTKSGELVYEIKDHRSDNSNVNILSTGNGETYMLQLPDNSKVWLNAASTLKYSSGLLVDGVRTVELNGEAYFEISKDAAHPFIVKTDHQKLSVLGTKFNIHAYAPAKQISTTLVEGSVNINDIYQLKPNNMAVNEDGAIKIQSVDTSIALAWVKNDFYFLNTSTLNVMSEIARWYDLKIVYTANDIKDIKLNVHISRSKSLFTVLERLGAAAHLHFRITDRHVLVERQH